MTDTMWRTAFMATKVADPLLCLTVSTTLREKPVPVTQPREALAALIEAAGGLPEPIPGTPSGAAEDGDGADRTGFEEVNLLEGLAIGECQTMRALFALYGAQYSFKGRLWRMGSQALCLSRQHD